MSEQSGDFQWTYPLRVPPVPGLAPDLALSYQSSTVDCRTSATNNQPSWVGDGWDLNPGFVERTYGACQDDKEGITPPDSGNLCWRSNHRGGWLERIDCGLHTTAASTPAASVVFTTADRCVPGSTCTLDHPEN